MEGGRSYPIILTSGYLKCQPRYCSVKILTNYAEQVNSQAIDFWHCAVVMPPSTPTTTIQNHTTSFHMKNFLFSLLLLLLLVHSERIAIKKHNNLYFLSVYSLWFFFHVAVWVIVSENLGFFFVENREWVRENERLILIVECSFYNAFLLRY